MRSFLSLLAAVFLLINAQWIVAVEPTAEATPDPAFTPITRNSDWTPVEREFDGELLVRATEHYYPPSPVLASPQPVIH